MGGNGARVDDSAKERLAACVVKIKLLPALGHETCLEYRCNVIYSRVCFGSVCHCSNIRIITAWHLRTSLVYSFPYAMFRASPLSMLCNGGWRTLALCVQWNCMPVSTLCTRVGDFFSGNSRYETYMRINCFTCSTTDIPFIFRNIKIESRINLFRSPRNGFLVLLPRC